MTEALSKLLIDSVAYYAAVAYASWSGHFGFEIIYYTTSDTILAMILYPNDFAYYIYNRYTGLSTDSRINYNSLLNGMNIYLGCISVNAASISYDINNLANGRCITGGYDAFSGVQNAPVSSFAGAIYSFRGYSLWQLAIFYDASTYWIRGYNQGNGWRAWAKIQFQS